MKYKTGQYLCEQCRARKPQSEYRLRSNGERMRYCIECQENGKSKTYLKREFVLSLECKDLRRKKAILVSLGKYTRKSMASIKTDALMRKADRRARNLGNKIYVQWMRSVEVMFYREPEQVEQRRVKSRARYVANACLIKDQYKKRYARNIEHERLRQVVYKHSNPDKVAKWGEKRKQMAAANADGSLTHSVCDEMFKSAKRCPYCERGLNAGNKTLDHIIPLSKGGAHGIHNVLIFCRTCNLRKKAMDFSEWMSTLSESCEKKSRAIYRQRYGADPTQREMELKYG